ncbi:signal peptidase II [Desulfopila sp. IMCC35008]|uniref:signal peptidase II n=1 Tax=Desulfopila sp. IMCC35008 TaxID=2653858 RepID=UPI0013D07781|nr:signal peptidase II [Desulfopila sp. IMCC35008]
MTARVATLFYFVAALGGDRLTKTMAASHLSPGEPVSYLFGTLRLHLVENHSGFLGYYGLLPEVVKDALLIWGTGTLILLMLLYLINKKGLNQYRQSSIALIMAGATGNLTDRFINEGGVIDFIVLALGPVQTGIFNLADVFILSGSAYLGYCFASTDK